MENSKIKNDLPEWFSEQQAIEEIKKDVTLSLSVKDEVLSVDLKNGNIFNLCKMFSELMFSDVDFYTSIKAALQTIEGEAQEQAKLNK